MAKKLKPVHPGEMMNDWTYVSPEFDSPRGVHGHSRTGMNKMAMDLRAPRNAHRRYRQCAPRHHCGHRTPLRALFQKQPYLLNEPADTLRPGNCRVQDRREGRAGRATVGNRCRPAVNEESRYEGSGPAATHAPKIQMFRVSRSAETAPNCSALCPSTPPAA
jgi:hypothetical protein